MADAAAGWEENRGIKGGKGEEEEKEGAEGKGGGGLLSPPVDVDDFVSASTEVEFPEGVGVEVPPCDLPSLYCPQLVECFQHNIDGVEEVVSEEADPADVPVSIGSGVEMVRDSPLDLHPCTGNVDGDSSTPMCSNRSTGEEGDIASELIDTEDVGERSRQIYSDTSNELDVDAIDDDIVSEGEVSAEGGNGVFVGDAVQIRKLLLKQHLPKQRKLHLVSLWCP